MEKDAIHDPDEERQQEYPQDATKPVRIGPGGELEPAEPEDPSETPAHGPRLNRRGRKPPRPGIDWRPHDRGYDVD